MKYATICALIVASSSAKDCLPGVKKAFWNGDDCIGDAEEETLDTE